MIVRQCNQLLKDSQFILDLNLRKSRAIFSIQRIFYLFHSIRMNIGQKNTCISPVHTLNLFIKLKFLHFYCFIFLSGKVLKRWQVLWAFVEHIRVLTNGATLWNTSIVSLCFCWHMIYFSLALGNNSFSFND